jgi:hypothetical protein
MPPNLAVDSFFVLGCKLNCLVRKPMACSRKRSRESDCAFPYHREFSSLQTGDLSSACLTAEQCERFICSFALAQLQFGGGRGIYNRWGIAAAVGCMGCRFTPRHRGVGSHGASLTIHRPGDDPCQECGRCMCAKFCLEWRVATISPEGILHSAPADCALLEMLDFFSMYVEQSVVMSSSPGVTRAAPVTPPPTTLRWSYRGLLPVVET